MDARVRYYTSGSRATIYFTREAIVLDIHGGEGKEGNGSRQQLPGDPEVGATMAPPEVGRGCALWISFAEGNPEMRVAARGRLPGYQNFFLGSDPARWRTNVPAYKEVVYHDLWPGMDLAFRIEGGALVYEILSPGKHPVQDGRSAIQGARFAYQGAELDVSPDGAQVRFDTAVGRITEIRPRNGEREGRFLLSETPVPGTDDARLREDRSDPGALLCGTFLGGSNYDWGYGVAVDACGQPIATGYTQSTSFPTTPGAYDVALGGSMDAFITKLSSAGDSLLWSTFLGGSGWDEGRDLVLDSSGNVIVTGSTGSTDFPTTVGAYDRTHNGSADAYVTKLASGGNAILWSTFLGGTGGDYAVSVVLDDSEDAFVTGNSTSTNFPTTPGAYDLSPNGGNDVFVSKFSSSGSALLWSTVLGGAADEYGWEVCVDETASPVISGFTMASSFPTTAGSYDPSYNGGERDAFVAKFSGTGSTLLWSTFLGGSNWDWSYGLALDESSNPVVTGGTMSSDFPTTPGAYDRSFALYDVFVAKLASAGNALLWSTFLGGSLGEEAYDVVLDAWGHPVVTGLLSSTDFPMTAGAYDDSYNGGGNDAFVAKLSEAGSELLWSSYLGGSLQDRGWTIALSEERDPVVVGHTESSDFPTTAGAYDPSFNGSLEAFVIKLHMSDPSAVGSRELGTSLAISLTGSSPFRDEALIQYVLPRTEQVEIRVFDPTGRAVTTLWRGLSPAGAHDLLWPGRDERGRPVPAGVYLVRLRAGGRAACCRLICVG